MRKHPECPNLRGLGFRVLEYPGRIPAFVEGFDLVFFVTTGFHASRAHHTVDRIGVDGPATLSPQRQTLVQSPAQWWVPQGTIAGISSLSQTQVVELLIIEFNVLANP